MIDAKRAGAGDAGPLLKVGERHLSDSTANISAQAILSIRPATRHALVSPAMEAARKDLIADLNRALDDIRREISILNGHALVDRGDDLYETSTAALRHPCLLGTVVETNVAGLRRIEKAK